MPKRDSWKWWLPTVSITALLIVGLGVIPRFQLTRTSVPGGDARLARLSERLSFLENKIRGAQSIAIVMDGERGEPETGATGRFSTTSAPIALIVSGTAHSEARDTTVKAIVQLDGATVATMTANAHRKGRVRFPMKVITVGGTTVGAHELRIAVEPSSNRVEDDDGFSAAVVELGGPN